MINEKECLYRFSELFLQHTKVILDISININTHFYEYSYAYTPKYKLTAMMNYHGSKHISLAISCHEDFLQRLLSSEVTSDNEKDSLDRHSQYGAIIKEILNTSSGNLLKIFQQDNDILTVQPPTVIYGAIELPKTPYHSLLCNTDIGDIEFSIRTDDMQQKLMRLYEQSEMVNEAKRLFLSNMSHELRTPLNSILGFSSALLRRLNNDTDKNIVSAIDSIYRNSDRLLNIVDLILDLTSIEAGKLKLSPMVIDVIPIVEQVIDQINILAEQKNLQIITNFYDKNSIITYCDKTRLQQMLLNLVSNAIKYTEIGNISIDVKETTNSIKFCISDTGIGIKSEDLSMLFTKFCQLDNSYTKKVAGTGLGLVITKELAALHGGNIEVESEYGVGSSFTLEIPNQQKMHAEDNSIR